MLSKQRARTIYNCITRHGSHWFRKRFLDSFGQFELGLTGSIAKNLSDSPDGKFCLGVEIGIMIGLDLAYEFRKGSK